jgi:glycerol-3-phosphate acyltransferase PlsY
MTAMPALLVCALLSYLAGSIPFGLILTRLAGHGDVRAIGSGNIGATNVLRTGNKKLAAATLICDALKGYAPVAIASAYGPAMAAVAMIAAPLGHIFPVWLGFKGGKGVATMCGALLAYAWPVAASALAVWFVVVLLCRYSSLAAIMAAASAPLFAFLFGEPGEMTLIVLVMAVIVIARHAGNIRRLVSGEESKIGRKRT